MFPVPFPVPGDGFKSFEYGRERTVVTDSATEKQARLCSQVKAFPLFQDGQL